MTAYEGIERLGRRRSRHRDEQRLARAHVVHGHQRRGHAAALAEQQLDYELDAKLTGSIGDPELRDARCVRRRRGAVRRSAARSRSRRSRRTSASSFGSSFATRFRIGWKIGCAISSAERRASGGRPSRHAASLRVSSHSRPSARTSRQRPVRSTSRIAPARRACGPSRRGLAAPAACAARSVSTLSRVSASSASVDGLAVEGADTTRAELGAALLRMRGDNGGLLLRCRSSRTRTATAAPASQAHARSSRVRIRFMSHGDFRDDASGALPPARSMASQSGGREPDGAGQHCGPERYSRAAASRPSSGSPSAWVKSSRDGAARALAPAARSRYSA